jgi:hypothetical protein
MRKCEKLDSGQWIVDLARGINDQRIAIEALHDDGILGCLHYKRISIEALHDGISVACICIEFDDC